MLPFTSVGFIELFFCILFLFVAGLGIGLSAVIRELNTQILFCEKKNVAMVYLLVA